MGFPLDSTRERTRLAPNAFALERNKRPLFRDIGVRYREADRRHSKSYMRVLRPRGERPLSCVFIRYWLSCLPPYLSFIRRREKTCMEKRKSPRRPHGFSTCALEFASQGCADRGAFLHMRFASAVCMGDLRVGVRSECSRLSNASATTLLPLEIFRSNSAER